MHDVIIIGAGAAGLMAAMELSEGGKTVLVLEAKEKAGGRMCTIQDPLFDLPVELGAEFVHGKLPLSRMLLKKGGIETYEVEGDIWRKEENGLSKSEFVEDDALLIKKFKELEEDITVQEFFDQHLQGEAFTDLRESLRGYVEGYYAAYLDKASTFALRDEWQNSDEEQYRIEGGYAALVTYMTWQLKSAGVEIQYNTAVQEIKWEKGSVQVITSGGIFRSNKVLITVSLGVLQAGALRFQPDLPHVTKAVHALGFGPVITTILQFHEPFWKNAQWTGTKDMSCLGFAFSSEAVPTWWTYHPKKAAMLCGWIGGPSAAALKDQSEEEIVQLALSSLARIFSVESLALKKILKGSRVFNWINDPFTCGGYAYETVGAKANRDIIRQPFAETIYFAGEGLHEGLEIGTVEAALDNGRDAAQRILASV